MERQMTSFPFFGQNDEERDLGEVVRRAAGTSLPKKFYRKAEFSGENSAYVLTLDGRKARTPARSLLSVPTLKLAEAIAAEWDKQGEYVDPDSMPLTRLANSAIDGVATKRAEVIDDLVRYAGSDLVCYRAEGPERLVREQAKAWDPVLAWCESVLNVKFRQTVGIVHIEQSPEALSALHDEIESLTSPFSLAALHVMTTLSGSVLIPLSHVLGSIGVKEAWNAANIDELFQESLWGKDEQAVLRREKRERDFRAASELFFIMSNA